MDVYSSEHSSQPVIAKDFARSRLRSIARHNEHVLKATMRRRRRRFIRDLIGLVLGAGAIYAFIVLISVAFG